jgi:hypothetical protein
VCFDDLTHSLRAAHRVGAREAMRHSMNSVDRAHSQVTSKIGLRPPVTLPCSLRSLVGPSRPHGSLELQVLALDWAWMAGASLGRARPFWWLGVQASRALSWLGVGPDEATSVQKKEPAVAWAHASTGLCCSLAELAHQGRQPKRTAQPRREQPDPEEGRGLACARPLASVSGQGDHVEFQV